MAERKYGGLGSALAPLKNLKMLGQRPVTLPIEPRAASENYRGFHLNDWELCIGCGTCAQICDNRAISMVNLPELTSDPLAGIKPRRPAIDYGRCCWCGLCVDVCPTGSLSLSQEYIHISPDPDTFFILPDPQGMHGLGYAEGWAKSDDGDLLDHERQPMPSRRPEQRIDDHAEVAQGFDDQAALVEASRCIQCGMCHDACPTHMHAPEYIRAIWSGDLEEAVEQIYRTNPLAHVCGRVCTHRCETACSMGHRGEPIAIRYLKRYPMDQVDHETIKRIATSGRETGGDLAVAIVGAGPAGLTAAFDLARRGHQVTIFEALSKPGGMMRWGIPAYRLPYPALEDDIDVIAAMGVEIRTGVRVGTDIAMEELQRDYDAVVLAIGLHKGRSTRIPGTEHPRVMTAVDLLRQVAAGEGPQAPASAVVIGGGNVAMDAARTVARMQTAHGQAVHVTATTLETREQMFASEEEIAEAEEEGIRVDNGRGPKACAIADDQLRGLETVRCVSVFDDDGRFHPKYDESDTRFYEADLIVEAIGQAPRWELLGETLSERLAWSRNRLQVDDDGRTSEGWLWAAGDAVEGPDVVHAIAAGHRVADSIEHNLSARRQKATA